ncbi:SDR family NAD(P)-dependent oxidoreductase [Streptomyces sp. NPDC101150]|uniref:SDR family NAD(P)-dependent oxidoreductase n=1 Tax=Streptomyces sp. NPDC101150 TaxID=3366114 RepID=UPI0038005B9E
MQRKHALVTGASQGLGAHIATRLAGEGWKVTGLGRRPADQAAARGIDYLQADLADPKQLQSLPGQLEQPFDLVVHNAVSYPAWRAGGPVAGDLEKAFAVNTYAPYTLTRALLATKPENRLCSVVVLNSESMFHADRDSGIYAASKAALRVLTGALAEENRSHNASVSTLLLGPVADPGKVAELRTVAAKRGVDIAEITRLFLRKSNPDLVIEELIDFDACWRSIEYIHSLGRIANGTVVRLDGGSAGSLI